jgi:hypothetical protein
MNHAKEMVMDIDNLTFGQIKKIQNLFENKSEKEKTHPMIGKRCLLRCHSAGVHIGTVAQINEETSTEVYLKDSIRLWKWSGGGLSLSAVANNGIKNGRLNETGDIYLTGVIEFIPVTDEAWESYEKFIED